MKTDWKLGVILLAAGRGMRFGANKLLCSFGGRPMVCSALDAVRGIDAARVGVVTCHDEIARLAGAYGYEVIVNDAPELGQSLSIRLGVEAMQDMDALLLMVCDQPRLSSASLESLVTQYAVSQKGIACLQDETHWGNPAVFSDGYFLQLCALEGDRGAKGILHAHQDDLLIVRAHGLNELSDADTLKALRELEAQREENIE